MPAAPALPPGPKRRLPGSNLLRIRRSGFLGLITELTAEYGDYAYFSVGGRKLCIVNDPETIRRIVVTDNAQFTKSHGLAGVKAALGDGLLTADGPLHTRQRRMIGPVFHAQQVKAYAADFVAQAARLADTWHDGQTLDLNQAMTELTLRVVTKSLFDTELEAEVGPIGQDMHALVSMFERINNPLAALMNKLPLPSNRRFKAALARLDARILGMIAARQAEATGDDGDATKDARFDLLSLLLMARDAHGHGVTTADDGTEPQGMSQRQVRDEAVTLFMAGHETTANALIWTFLLLAEHPEADTALAAELAEVLQGRPATADDMPRLKYARAVIAESMRLRPPAWVIARLTAHPYAVGPYRVPAGTTLLMSQYVVHRDPRWWPDAEAFRPARWLAPAAASDGRERPKYAYFPFGGGPRSCVGEPFAWLEAITLLATLTQRWRLDRADTTPVELFPTITLRPKRMVRMTVHAR